MLFSLVVIEHLGDTLPETDISTAQSPMEGPSFNTVYSPRSSINIQSRPVAPEVLKQSPVQ